MANVKFSKEFTWLEGRCIGWKFCEHDVYCPGTILSVCAVCLQEGLHFSVDDMLSYSRAHEHNVDAAMTKSANKR